MDGAKRIIDVNLNRLAEGLKVVEDVCRFHLGDAESVRRVREMRFELSRACRELGPEVLPFRQSRQDIGRHGGFDRSSRADLAEVMTANLKRVQEASRVLEEVSKAEIREVSPIFKSIRFRAYDLEQEIEMKLARKLNLRLYVVLDTATTGRGSLKQIARELARAKPDVVQLREPKDLPTREFLKDASMVRRVLADTGVVFIVNDRADIALATDADGVHLGQEDMPLHIARGMLPRNKIIGVSVSSPAQARSAERGGADYLGVGALFATPSKPEARVVGLSGLRVVRKVVRLPLVAIGGINIRNLRSVIRAGADGVAVISAVYGSGRIKENIRNLVKCLDAMR